MIHIICKLGIIKGDVRDYHLVFEFALILLLMGIVFIPRKKTPVVSEDLTDEEIQLYVKEWAPEPLISTHDKVGVLRLDQDPLNSRKLVLDGMPVVHCIENGKEFTNFTTSNFLGLIGNPKIIDEAIAASKKYGVGSCGPRGFYGTFDAHLELEERITRFMKTESTITYSYGFATVASAIPAYSKIGDVIFCDDKANFAIQKGVQASKSNVIWFKHNDMRDLEDKMDVHYRVECINPVKAAKTRKFIIVEGMNAQTGCIVPLPKIIELKYKYKARIIIDESVSFGVLGLSGRGITEHHNVCIEDIDMICASYESNLTSIGGFSTGPDFVISHQRLSGSGYAFSASLPPLLAKAATKAIDILDAESATILEQLRTNIDLFHSLYLTTFQSDNSIFSNLQIDNKYSPIIHIILKSTTQSHYEKATILEKACSQFYNAGLLVSRAKYLEPSEKNIPEPSIRVNISASHTAKDIKLLISQLYQISNSMTTAK